MRVKFPDEPSKFVESEVELDDEIKRMHAIAAVPELYPILVKVRHARHCGPASDSLARARSSWTP